MSDKWGIRISTFICASFLLLLVVFAFDVQNNNELHGVFTNGRTENCEDFISIAFDGDRFVSTIHVALDEEAAAREHIADRVQRTADGKYFIRVVQRGTFYITSSDTESITKVLTCGGIIYNEFSQLGNSIIIAQTQLTRGRQI
jgi:hypothetical protein